MESILLEHKKKDKHYHKLIAREYDKVVVEPRKFTNNIIYSRLNKHLKKKYSKGLDLGCGTGHMSIRYARRIRKIDAVDSSAEMIEMAKINLSNYSNIIYHTCDFKDFFNYNKKLFDIILCTGFIHHLHKNEIKSLLKVIASHLKPRGEVIISEPIKVQKEIPDEIQIWNSKTNSRQYSIEIKEPDEEPLDKEAFLKILKDAGFEIKFHLQSWEIFPRKINFIYNYFNISKLFRKYLGEGNVLTLLIEK